MRAMGWTLDPNNTRPMRAVLHGIRQLFDDRWYYGVGRWGNDASKAAAYANRADAEDVAAMLRSAGEPCSVCER